MQAAADGDIALMKMLLEFGANIEAINDQNERALGFACSWNQPHAARMLLERGAEPNAPEDPHRTYLDWAIIGEQTNMMELLVSFGALTFAKLKANNAG